MAADSVDSIVTDPPYDLLSIHERFKNSVRTESTTSTSDAHQRFARGFMGQTWDGTGVAFDPETWRHAWRVLKPGGYLIAFGGTRTYHRMACAIEDAGFEIRDCIAWVYGSGFSKSHSVEMAIWKWSIACQSKENAPLAIQISESFLLKFDGDTEHIVVALAQILPEDEPALLIQTGKVDDLSDLTVMRLSEPELERISSNIATLWKTRSVSNCDPRSMFTTETKNEPITELTIWAILRSASIQNTITQVVTLKNGPTLPAAFVASYSSAGRSTLEIIPTLTVLETATENPVKTNRGRGTSLKPAMEPIVVARKPLIGSVAANVLAYGTGAINIDGCRVPSNGPDINARDAKQGDRSPGYEGGFGLAERAWSADTGRFPANFIHDGSDEVIALFPTTTSGYTNGTKNGVQQSVFGKYGPGQFAESYGDSGSAARFFYCAKASKADRNSGLPDGERSIHPTVKPTDLMRYLCRMHTPPGGLILDPFTGSGSTGKAAMLEGFRFVGCEMTAEYLPIAQTRIRHAELQWLAK